MLHSLFQDWVMMKGLFTVKHIADLADVSPATVRRLVDRGHVEANRNYCGWRIFGNPERAVEKIRFLLSGMDEKNSQLEDKKTSGNA